MRLLKGVSLAEAAQTGAASVHSILSLEELCIVLMRVNKHIKETDIPNVEHYAFISGRNFAVSRQRKQSAAARRVVARQHQARRDAKAAAEKAEQEAARLEARDLITHLLTGPLSPAHRRRLMAFWGTFVLRQTAEENARILGTTVVNAWQLTKRGKDLVEPHASPRLRAWL